MTQPGFLPYSDTQVFGASVLPLLVVQAAIGTASWEPSPLRWYPTDLALWASGRVVDGLSKPIQTRKIAAGFVDPTRSYTEIQGYAAIKLPGGTVLFLLSNVNSAPYQVFVVTNSVWRELKRVEAAWEASHWLPPESPEGEPPGISIVGSDLKPQLMDAVNAPGIQVQPGFLPCPIDGEMGVQTRIVSRAQASLVQPKRGEPRPTIRWSALDTALFVFGRAIAFGFESEDQWARVDHFVAADQPVGTVLFVRCGKTYSVFIVTSSLCWRELRRVEKWWNAEAWQAEKLGSSGSEAEGSSMAEIGFVPIVRPGQVVPHTYETAVVLETQGLLAESKAAAEGKNARVYWNKETKQLRARGAYLSAKGSYWRTIAEGFEASGMVHTKVQDHSASGYAEGAVLFHRRGSGTYDVFIRGTQDLGTPVWRQLVRREEYWNAAAWAKIEGEVQVAGNNENNGAQTMSANATKTGPTRLDQFVSISTKEGLDAAWQTTAVGTARTVRDFGVITLKRVFPKQKLWIGQAAKLLSHPIGEGVFTYGLGWVIELQSKPEDLKRKRLASECRKQGMASGLLQIMEPVRTFLMAQVDLAMNALPDLPLTEIPIPSEAALSELEAPAPKLSYSKTREAVSVEVEDDD